ncbi:MAG: hypothetical protein HUJ24_05435 [Rhodobacteraceae bacterium]|nr:hypothetical protein [Paracoccaceae bacterium]
MRAALRDPDVLIPALCLAQLAFLVVFANHFYLERGMIGGNADLYAYARERLSVFGLSPDFYDAQYQNAAYDDSIDYLVAIAGAETREPFRFRVIYIWLIQGLTALTSDCETIRSGCGLKAAAFAAKLVNWGGIVATFAVLLAAAPVSRRGSPATLALALAGAFSFGTLMTAPFVMADILCGLIFALAALFYLQHRFVALVATVAVGVLIKDISIVLGILVAAELFRAKRRPLALILAVGVAPIAVFVGVRLLMGGDPLSLNYGWEVSRGEFEIRYLYYHATDSFSPFLLKAILGAGIAGIIYIVILHHNRYKSNTLIPFAVVWIGMLFVNLFLASGVVRVQSPLAAMFATVLIWHGLGANRAQRNAT